MAIIGRIPDISKHFKNNTHFQAAFEYFVKAMDPSTPEFNRIESLPLGAFERFELGNGIFAIEQKFDSKNRVDCFFESHIKYIDIQMMVNGNECMEYNDIHKFSVKEKYNSEKDLIIYNDFSGTTKILLTSGDFALFFPQDVHMGCQMHESSTLCTKTVVKMPLEYFTS
jgi:YhcH/YjgK/YiaL family protein